MTRERLTFLFNQYTNGTISDREKAEFLHALSLSENDVEVKKLIDELWISLPEQEQSKDLEHVFEHIINPQEIQKTHRTSGPWLKIAASISLLTIVSLGLIYLTVVKPKKLPSSEIVHGKQQNSFIKLPDGSTVVLNVGSHLDYPETFKDRSVREVALVGEGYFDIQHDPTRPFIVRTRDVVTTVLGTAFNVRAYPGEKIMVTVSRGKVKVSANNNMLGLLTRDQKITVNNGNVKSKETVNARKETAWKETDIVFNDVTLKEALEELAARFSVEVTLANDAAYDCRFTGSFVHEENIDQILTVLSEFNNVKMVKDEQSGAYLITGDGCNQ